jgi:hypothetical protein
MEVMMHAILSARTPKPKGHSGDRRSVTTPAMLKQGVGATDQRHMARRPGIPTLNSGRAASLETTRKAHGALS